MIIVVVFDGDTAFVDHPLLGIAAQKTKGIMVADNPLYGQIFGINLVGAFAFHVRAAVWGSIILCYIVGQQPYEFIQRGGKGQNLLVWDLHFFRPDFGVAARVGLEAAAKAVGECAEEPLHGLSSTVIGSCIYRSYPQLIHQRHRIILAETAGAVVFAVVEVHLIGYAVLLDTQAEAFLYSRCVGVCISDKKGHNRLERASKKTVSHGRITFVPSALFTKMSTR